MKYSDNVLEVAALQPDYMGFIFYKGSKRNVDTHIPELPSSIKKTGVFVNASIAELVKKTLEFDLQAIQLHGDESVAYIRSIKEIAELNHIEIIKVFSVQDPFDFNILKPFLAAVDYFLFDTKGKERGGNGQKFDWSLLKQYPYDKPFFLSGGISPSDSEALQSIEAAGLPIYAVDINSQFETAPGVKDIDKIKAFKN